MDSRRPRSELPAPEKTVNTRGWGVPPTQGAPRSGAGGEGADGVLLVSDVPRGRWVGGAEARITGLPDPRAQAEGPASQGGQADAAAGVGRCCEVPTGPLLHGFSTVEPLRVEGKGVKSPCLLRSESDCEGLPASA